MPWLCFSRYLHLNSAPKISSSKINFRGYWELDDLSVSLGSFNNKKELKCLLSYLLIVMVPLFSLLSSIIHFTDKKAKVQTNSVICPRSPHEDRNPGFQVQVGQLPKSPPFCGHINLPPLQAALERLDSELTN